MKESSYEPLDDESDMKGPAGSPPSSSSDEMRPGAAFSVNKFSVPEASYNVSKVPQMRDSVMQSQQIHYSYSNKKHHSARIGRFSVEIKNNFYDDDSDDNIGLSFGGSKDVNNFRKLIKNGKIPNKNDITYQGLLYEYYFDTKNNKQNNNNNYNNNNKLFYPSYCYAKTKKLILNNNNNNIDSNEYEYYITLGLNSNIKQNEFKRKKLNLIIVLDTSESMVSSFDTGSVVSKINVASKAIITLMKHLNNNDRFGLITFNDDAEIRLPITIYNRKNYDKLKKTILGIGTKGGNNFEKGYTKAIDCYNKLIKKNIDISDSKDNRGDIEYENRIIFITDACPNVGITDSESLLGLCSKYSSEGGIFTTFIGVGIDFNSTLIHDISQMKGCNYYTVNTNDEFESLMNDDFEYMVTPLVFNVSLVLKSKEESCIIQNVYGCNEDTMTNILKTGEITHIHTLFPSKKSSKDGGTKGGIMLIQLNKNNISESISIDIEVKYEDRNGIKYENKQSVCLDNNDNENDSNEYYDNIGIRKGILLCKYVELIRNWIDNKNSTNNFKSFLKHFKNEMNIINDAELDKELVILNILSKWKPKPTKTPKLEFKDVYDFYFPSFNKFPQYFEYINDNLLDIETLIQADMDDLIEIGFKKIHAKYAIKQIDNLRNEINDFDDWLNKLKLNNYKDSLQNNYIYTFSLLNRKVKRLDDLIQIIGGSSHKNSAQIIWNKLQNHNKLHDNNDAINEDG